MPQPMPRAWVCFLCIDNYLSKALAEAKARVFYLINYNYLDRIKQILESNARAIAANTQAISATQQLAAANTQAIANVQLAIAGPSNARSNINKFLSLEAEEEGLISNTPRIILIAPSFSQEITTTVLWLNEAGIDIRCMEVNLYNINNEEFLNIEQIIPLPSAEDYQIKIREKTNQAVKEASNKQRREKSIKTLIDNGILQEGTRVQLIRSPKSELEFKNIEDKAKYATFEKNSQKFKWDFDEQSYSLSLLCKTICQLYNAPIGAGAFPGPDFWAVEGDDKPLSERAKESLLNNKI